MNILVLSNCQGDGILFYLQQKISANYKKFHIHKWDGNGINKKLLRFLQMVDIFIFTFLSQKFEQYSTDLNSNVNIFKYLNENCIKIGVPTIYNTAFWCVIPDFSCKRKDDGHNEIIELKKKYSLNQILKKYDNNEINFNLKKRFENCQKHTKDLEDYYKQFQDLNIITITDFILNNYKDHKLFCTHNHPSSYIIIYITNEIIKIINHKKNLNTPLFNNIFQYQYNLGVHSGNWIDSKYLNIELDVNYQTYIDESKTKKLIENIYNEYKI